MADEQVIEQPVIDTTDAFDGREEAPKTAEEAAAKVVEEKKIEEKPVVEPVEEILDTKDYVKARFGFNSEEEGVEELRTLRERAQTPAEIKFANEQSEKFFDYLKEGKEDDVYSYLTSKKQLERIDKLDVTKVTDAAEIIRLNLQYKYPDLTPDEIVDIFQETYVRPIKPVQGELQTNEDYQADVDRWNQQCQAIDKRVIREAKMAKPELAKFKSELVLPDIPSKQQEQQQAEPTQEELAAQAQAKATYLKSMDTGLNTFTGYKITYKDEAVEIPISYDATPEEKAALKPAIEKLYSSYEEYFGPRWRNADGSINSAKVIEDIHLLENKGKVLQKLTNESGAQRLKQQLKTKSNIEVEGTIQRTQIPDQKALQQKKEDAIWEMS
jgi:hypothetical protein